MTPVQSQLESLEKSILPVAKKLNLVDVRWGQALTFSRSVYDTPLIRVSLSGPTNAGKSTLFNAITSGHWMGDIASSAKDEKILISSISRGTGHTKTPVISINPQHNVDEVITPFTTQYGAIKRLTHATDPEQADSTAYLHQSEGLPKKIALIDLPDTNSKNLENKKRALEWIRSSEVIAFVFNQHTMGDKANLEFMQQTLAEIGDRKIILIDRFFQEGMNSEDFSRQVTDGFLQIAHTLFPRAKEFVGTDQLPHQIIGCYNMALSPKVATSTILLNVNSVT